MGGPRRLVHLKTKEECRLGTETIAVWTVEMPSKCAESVLKVVKDHIPGQDSIDLQHLRRFAKPKFLPPSLLGSATPSGTSTPTSPVEGVTPLSFNAAWVSTPTAALLQAPTMEWKWDKPARSRSNSKSPTLHLLICPVAIIPKLDLEALLKQYPPFSSDADSWAFTLSVREVIVPRLAPTSPEQAEDWTRQFWPTFYRKTNPFGAHPSIIAKAEAQLYAGSNNVEKVMNLALKVGAEARGQGSGIGTGCVILERDVLPFDDRTEIVAVAGDARSHNLAASRGGVGTQYPGAQQTAGQGICAGNIMGHAAMRAIGLVGKKRLRLAAQPIRDADVRPPTLKEKTKPASQDSTQKTGDSTKQLPTKPEPHPGNPATNQHSAQATANPLSDITNRLKTLASPAQASRSMSPPKRENAANAATAVRSASPTKRTRNSSTSKAAVVASLMGDERSRNSFFLDVPITPTERKYFDLDNLKPDGYLCLDLEMVLTHEPCVMCCMAIIHSRFGRVVFGKRMSRTGGLTAEMDANSDGEEVGPLGYGLPWRKELNWKFLCWQYEHAGHAVANDDDVTVGKAGDKHHV